MIEIWVVLDDPRRELGVRLDAELDLVAAASLADWLAGENQEVGEPLTDGWRVPVREKIRDFLETSTDQDRREFAAKLMATDEVGYGSDKEAVLRVLDKLADLARRAQRQGKGLLLTAGE